MIKAELSYNPYLQKTIVKFNGQAPRINSLVEKYENGNLQEWIQKVPMIFHDEMNGYGFELIFSGTEADFKNLKKAFKDNGVSENEVEVIMKNKLEGPVEKNNRITDLLKWLDENKNRRFDYEKFKDDYKEILEAPYSYITINGKNMDTVKISGEEVSVENIEKISEIQSNDLKDIPIVMVINSDNLVESRENVKYIVNNGGINENQIFFLIDPILNKQQIERTIIDLGVKNPLIVDEFNDKKIEEFFELYPLTNYIRNMIYYFRESIVVIQENLEKETQKSRVQNETVYDNIDDLENEIERLKDADDFFIYKDSYTIPAGFKNAVSLLFFQIRNWRNKKIKTNKIEEAKKMAVEYDNELEKIMESFWKNIIQTTNSESKRIEEELKAKYSKANVDASYQVDVVFNKKLPSYKQEKLYDIFMDLKNEQFVDSKEGLLNKIKVNSDNKKKEQVLEITYQYEVWRAKAIDVYKPIAEKLIEDRKKALEKYYQDLSDAYHNHINDLIKDRMSEKDKESSKLSDDEKLLQSDSDWLAEFKDKLHLIERG